jgi:hypothetical protein
MVTGYGLDDRGIGVLVPLGSRIFAFSYGAHPTFYPVGTGGVKQQEREAHQSLVSSFEVNKTWIYTSIPTYVFTSQCLISLAEYKLTVAFLLWKCSSEVLCASVLVKYFVPEF